MVNSNGASHETTLYDLKVFNYLVMRLDTDRAWEMKAKFNDVLVERETQTQSVQPTIYDYARALIAEKERSDALINRGVVNDVKNLTSLNIKNEKARRISRVSDMKHVDVRTR